MFMYPFLIVFVLILLTLGPHLFMYSEGWILVIYLWLQQLNLFKKEVVLTLSCLTARAADFLFSPVTKSVLQLKLSSQVATVLFPLK